MPRKSKKAIRAEKSKELQDIQKTWEERILRAKKVRKAWKELFKVDMAREYFDGKQRPPEENSRDWITINNVYSHLKSQLPSLYSADPYFYVKLKRSHQPNPMMIAAYEKKGKIRQSYLNYLKEELNLKTKARLGIQDAHFSYGVLKSHYNADMVTNEDFGQPIQDDDGNTLIDELTGQPLTEPEKIPINGRYSWTRVHPDDFLWDEDAGPLEDEWGWVAQRIREPFEVAKKNPKLNKRVLDSIKTRGNEKDDEEKHREERKKGTEIKDTRSGFFKDKQKQPEPELLVRWEIYNLEKDTWLVIAENADEPLMQEEPLPKGVDRHSFSILRFTLRDDSPYPIPPISQGIDPSREYNTARSRILKHRKRFNRKYEVWETAVDDTEIAKLESGADGSVIKKRQPEQAVMPIKDAPLDQMNYAELGYLKQDMIEMFGGSTDEARGIAGADSATQAGILDKRLEMKEGDAMSMVIDFIKDAARKMDMLVQCYIERDEAVRVTGPQGEFWELVRVDDYGEIEGEYEYTVNVGATVPRMPQMERSSWMAFLTLLQGFPHLLTNDHLLKRMAEMHHIEDELMLAELKRLGQMILGGQVPMPGQSGSQAGVSEDRPTSAMGGMAGGIKSVGNAV